MKICWDNLERFKFSKNGYFIIDSSTYVEMEACKGCGEPYLTQKQRMGPFCDRMCANSGKNHPNYKGGIYMAGLSTYDTYKDRLKIYEDVRKQENTEILEVKCTYCGRWYAPTHSSVNRRLIGVDAFTHGEGRLYCSENCKMACPIFGQKTYPKGFKHTSSREVDPYLRKMVLERDNWTCQICGKTINEAQLHCHHMDPVAQNPMFQNDMDSCITLCKGCHKMVHKQYGCRYIDLRCK